MLMVMMKVVVENEVKNEDQARKHTCLSTPIIPPIWIIKPKSVSRTHQSPHCSQMTPRCVEGTVAHRETATRSSIMRHSQTLVMNYVAVRAELLLEFLSLED